ncbi:hypothetical protein [Micrococcus luteus]|uniref:hypothetical protein n=1 Tax=Micrococcus luteus TaxID=1270 RepID=UPI0036C1E852
MSSFVHPEDSGAGSGLPPLDSLAYDVDDDGEHPGGGHCAGFGGVTPEDDRRAMIEQYRQALDVLVDSALESDDGWSLSRPILFTTHQLCELALSLVLEVKGLKPGSQHSLETRMAAAIGGNAFDRLTNEERQWCHEFIAAIVPLTGDGFPGRYANARINGVQLDERWCCINPQTIRNATVGFAALCLSAIEADA